jgi:hypothetical protein
MKTFVKLVFGGLGILLCAALILTTLYKTGMLFQAFDASKILIQPFIIGTVLVSYGNKWITECRKQRMPPSSQVNPSEPSQKG